VRKLGNLFPEKPRRAPKGAGGAAAPNVWKPIIGEMVHIRDGNTIATLTGVTKSNEPGYRWAYHCELDDGHTVSLDLRALSAHAAAPETADAAPNETTESDDDNPSSGTDVANPGANNAAGTNDVAGARFGANLGTEPPTAEASLPWDDVDAILDAHFDNTNSFSAARCDHKTISTVPKGGVEAYAAVLDLISQAATNTSNWRRQRQGLALLVLHPAMLLRPFAQHFNTPASNAEFRKRCQRFLAGEWSDLLAEVPATAPRTTHNPTNNSEATAQKRLRRALKEAKAGRLSKAVQTVLANASAPYCRATAEALNALQFCRPDDAWGLPEDEMEKIGTSRWKAGPPPTPH
jgi:hypothetical protein